MVNDEVRFAKILEDIKFSAGSAGGFIKEEEVKEAFEELDLSTEQLSMVFDFLRKNNIGINEPIGDNSSSANQGSNILKEYKEELGSLQSLSKSQLRAYSIAAMAGEEEARQKLLLHYLPQVVEISKLYAHQGFAPEDLIGEGNLALAEGVNMIDALEKPEEIEGMLIKLVMDAMEEYISDSIKLSSAGEKLAEKVNEVADAAASAARDYGRKVTVEELADESGLGVKRIKEAIKLSGNKIEDIDYNDESNQ